MKNFYFLAKAYIQECQGNYDKATATRALASLTADERCFLYALENDDAQGVINAISKGLDVNKEFEVMVVIPDLDGLDDKSLQPQRPLDITSDLSIQKLLISKGAKSQEFFEKQAREAWNKEHELLHQRDAQQTKERKERNKRLVEAFLS